MKRRKLIGAVLAIVFGVSALTGCGNSGQVTQQDTSADAESQQETTETTDDAVAKTESEPQKVTNISLWCNFFDSANQAAEKSVVEAMNEYSREKIGVTVSLQYYAGNEYGDKLTMALAAKEDVDLFFTASWMKFFDLCRQDALMDLTDLLPQYGDLYAVMPESIWESSEVEGRRYFVPNYKESFLGYSVITPIELADTIKEKYGIDFNEIECDSIMEFGNYEDYVLACQKEGVEMPNPGGIYFANLIGLTDKYEKISGVFIMDKETHEVMTYFETPECAEYMEMAMRWNREGIWKEEQLMSDYDEFFYLNSGSFGIEGWQTVPDNENQASARYNVPVYVHEVTPKYINSDGAMGSGWSISAYSEKADACLKWLELLNTDTTFADMFIYGLEGEQYTRDENGIVTQIPDSGWVNYTWASTNYMVPSLLSTESPDKKEQYSEANEAALSATLLGFRPATENVSNELAAINAVETEVYHMLHKGFYAPSELDGIIEKVKAAGADTVTAEFQAQVDAFFVE